MTTTEIEASVIKIVSEELNMDSSSINSETNINENSDSLVMKFEEVFDIVIPAEDQDFDTVNDAVVCIDGILNGSTQADI